jgi:hypothetical protein
MEARDAYERGMALAAQGRHTESTAFFRRALQLRPDLWHVQFDYSTALANATVEVAPHRGIQGPVTRSSWERVAMIREAMVHMAAAEAVAPDGVRKALSRQRLASFLAVWELQWDVLHELQLAMLADSTRPAFREAFATQVARMRSVRGMGGR